MTKVLLLASGMSVKQHEDYPYKENGWIILAVNNAWAAAPDLWDYWVRAGDYKGKRPTYIKDHQTEVKSYRDSLNKYGGQKECGYSITLNAGYWALDKLQPSVIGLLGADMNYTPAEDGSTHFYGVGWDVKNNKCGKPDPDRMADLYGRNNPNYLHDIYMRLAHKAKEQGCKVYNLSTVEDTRLPYEKVTPSSLK